MSVELIRPEQEKQLMAAMVEAIRETNQGADPNAALAKQAVARGFNEEFGRRMVETYNTSRSLHHFDSNPPEKRAETFDIANPDIVIQMMYGTMPTEKKAAVSVPVENVKINFNLVQDEPVCFTKAASAQEVAADVTVIDDSRCFLTKVSNYRREIAAELRHEKEALLKIACELADTFSVPGSAGFDEVEAKLRFHYKDLAKNAMDFVWGLRNFEAQGEKRASEAATLAQSVVGTRTDQFAVARQLMSQLTKCSETQADLDKFNAIAKPIEAHIHAAFEKLSKVGLVKKSAPKPAKKDPLFPEPPGELFGGAGGEVDVSPSMKLTSHIQNKPGGLELSPQENAEAQARADAISEITHRAAHPEFMRDVVKQTAGKPYIVNVAQVAQHAPETFKAYGLGEQPYHGMNLAIGNAMINSLQQELGQYYGQDRAQEMAKAMVTQSRGVNPERAIADAKAEIERQQASENDTSKYVLDALQEGKVPFVPTALADLLGGEPGKTEQIVTPQHEANLRSVNMKVLANDMLANDPVLSAYSPEEVISTLNQIAATVPSLSTNPLMMRSVVARVLQQGGRIDPTEIKQLLDAEESSRKLRIKGY